MNDTDESSLADPREVFLRQLSARSELIARRVDGFVRTGWDINGLALIHAESRRLVEGSVAHDYPATVEALGDIAELLTGVLEREELPDAELGERLHTLARRLQQQAPPAPAVFAETYVPADLAEEFALMKAADAARGDPAPAVTIEPTNHWGDDVALFGKSGANAHNTPASPTAAAAKATPVAATSPAAPIVLAANAMAAASARWPAATADGKPPAMPSDFRLYHLTDYGPLSLELDQRLEAMGLEVELLEDVAELTELLSALPADLVLMDACFTPQLDAIGAAVRSARGHNNKHRLLLVAITEADDVALRLSARRAGVDALVVDPLNAADVLNRLEMLVDPKREAGFRIMIVEDDRSQALFAEGILRNAGMDSLVVLDGLDVMPAAKQFRPDLILMDLNMPGANGIELTALIREQEAFAHTPILFLSGESSDDLQFDAIDAGGDDFLSKPIRPRHLISAVQTRVRRARQQESRRAKRADKDASTGLAYRSSVLKQLDQCLHRGQQRGGLLYLEVESLGALRDRIGLTALETLLGEVSRLITGNIGEMPATRFADGSYLLIDSDREELSLDSLAAQLRHTIMHTSFQALGHPLRLRISAGVCAFKHGFDEAGAMINAVERVAREARTYERGVHRYEPPHATEMLKEAALVAQLRAALEHDSLVLLYQPVVAVAGNDVSQYQLLLRLRDATGKLHAASELIPVVERSSLIVEVDRWVMSQALA
ncbi:MAG: response regulator, partial [Arenimonas sp.]